MEGLALMVEHKWDELAAMDQDSLAICKRVIFAHAEDPLCTTQQITRLGEGDDEALFEELEQEEAFIAKRRRTASRE